MKKLVVTVFVSLLSTTAFADVNQKNVAVQNAQHSNQQIGKNNISVIHSHQKLYQANAAFNKEYTYYAPKYTKPKYTKPEYPETKHPEPKHPYTPAIEY